MKYTPKQLSLAEWDRHYADILSDVYKEPAYGGHLSRHVDDKDYRLKKLLFDNSTAALDLWNFLLTEEVRLREDRAKGKLIVGAMKDLGTVPVMAYSFANITAFYPDGAWWIPCIMELSAGLLDKADSLGIDDSFCPARAMLGAFATDSHFPIPDLLICSVGATCDDFTAIAQRLQGMGHAIHWWEIPHRRHPEKGESAITLPGGFEAPVQQVEFVKNQLQIIRTELSLLAEEELTDERLCAGIVKANQFRDSLRELRKLTFTAKICPLPALELLIAEMLSIHFCSDQEEAIRVVDALLATVRERISQNEGYFGSDAVRVFWVNPVADLQAMNLLEECGGRICGTEYLFSHALDPIPTEMPPLDALAQMALADPMVGSSSDRADRICRDIELFGAEAVIISRIPGASHCALESDIMNDTISSRLDIPVLEIEVPPMSSPLHSALKTRIQGLIETVKGNR